MLSASRKKHIEMKNILMIIIGLGIGVNNLYSQWIQTNGPYGNSNVLAVFEYDSNYFASTYLCGLFSKSSTENPWNLNSDIYFKTYTIKGDSLFADATYFAGGANRYMGVQLFDLNNPEASPITIDSMITSQVLKHSDTFLFGGNESAGFFKLSFDGTFLEYCNNGLPTDTIVTTWGTTYYETNVSAIELTDNYIFCGTNNGVYRCDTNFNPWSEINNGLSIGNVTFIEEILDTLYTSIDKNLYYSSDSGNNWSLLYSSPSKITSFQKEESQIFVSTLNNGVYYSIDNGISWNSMNSGLTDLSVNFITQLDSVIFCGTNTKGIFKYYNGAWLNDNSGMVCSFIWDITNTDSKIVAIEDRSIYLYSNNTYIDITPNVTNDMFLNIDNMGDTIFVSNYYNQSNWPYINQFFYYSYDEGNTWTEIGNLPYTTAGGNSSHSIYIENNRIYASSDEKMFYSDDIGINWTDISLPSQYCNSFNDFLVYNSTPYAAACGNGQLVRLNNTNNWILSNSGLPTDREPLELAYCDSSLFTYVHDYGMYVSFNNGINWSYASYGLNAGDYGIRDFAFLGQHLFVSTENGVFVTSNFGQNWYECNDGLNFFNISSLTLFNDTLYVGTYGNGIWKRAIDNINLSISEFNNNKYDIKIYPNPATDYLIIDKNNIDFENIKIIDLLGRQILSEKMNTNKIDIQNILNGIYILILSSNGEFYNTKIIINR